MSDDLREHFEAFRAASVARTKPPGADVVRRTVIRRYATRAAALATVAVALALSMLLPGGESPRQPTPAGPTVSPSVSSEPSHSPSPTPTPSSPQAGSTAAVSCVSRYGLPVADLLVSGYPDRYELPAKLLQECPDATVTIVQASFAGLGASSNTLSMESGPSRTLSAGQPRVDLPRPARQASPCATYVALTLAGTGSVPKSVPNPVPYIKQTGFQGELEMYWRARGYEVLAVSWSEPVCS